jgi:hypothetical protein
MTVALTYFNDFLQNNYVKGEIAKLINKDHPFLDYMTTTQSGGGLQLVDVLIDRTPAGRGATLALAQAGSQQANNSNTGGAQWVIPWGEYNECVEIPDKVIAQSASDLTAFFQNKKEDIDGLYSKFADGMSQYLFADSGRSLASCTESTGVLTLANAADANKFMVGDMLQASANDGTSTSHTLLGSGSIGYVIAKNEGTGTVTVSATSGGSAGTPASWTGTMYIFRNGDFGGTSSPNYIIHGLQAFIPATDPSDTFCNVNRAINVGARSGVRLTATDVAGLSTEQRLGKLCNRMLSASYSSTPSAIFLHPMAWYSLSEDLGARGIRPLNEKLGQFSFETLKIITPGGAVPIIADKFCPLQTAFAVNKKWAQIRHLDGFPKVVSGDGLTMLRKSDSNNYEFRLVSYPAFYVKAPGYFGRTPLSVSF